MNRFNPLMNILGLREGLRMRSEHADRQETKVIRKTIAYKLAAGREPVYRATLSDERENTSFIESLPEVLEEIRRYNSRRPVTFEELRMLVRLSPSEVVRRFRHVNPEDLANLTLLMRRAQRLARSRTDLAADPIDLMVISQTEYYRNLPPDDERHLARDESWLVGDEDRPFLADVFDEYRRRG